MNTLRLFGTVVAAVLAMTSGAAGCSSDVRSGWACRDPATGMDTVGDYDLNHYVNRVFDPCHCLDPGGPRPTCPTVADAGPDVADAGVD